MRGIVAHRIIVQTAAQRYQLISCYDKVYDELMYPRQWLISMGILAYLFLTFCAWTYTLFRWSPLPWHAERFFFGMMAPYQGYSLQNVEMVAEGKRANGTWERIDVQSYFPGSRGERNFRSFLLDFRTSDEAAKIAYKKFAGLVRTHESIHGKLYDEVRITFDAWPVSPEGWYAMRKPPFVQRVDPLLSLE